MSDDFPYYFDEAPPAPDDREDVKQALQIFLALLLGDRFRAKEIAANALALAIRSKHYRVHGYTVAELADKLGVSRASLHRRVAKLKCDKIPE